LTFVSLLSQFHNPLPAKAGSGDNANGKKSFTFRQLEKIQQELGVVIDAAAGILITELNSIASGTGVMTSSEAEYDELCGKSIKAVLALNTRIVIAFGAHTQLRWRQYFKAHASKFSFQVSHGVHTARGDFVMAGQSRSVHVIFSPHPCLWQMERVVRRAMAIAHGVDIVKMEQGSAEKDEHGHFVQIQSITLVERPTQVINIEVEGQEEEDKRYVLEGGVVTHNSVYLQFHAASMAMTEEQVERARLSMASGGVLADAVASCLLVVDEESIPLLITKLTDIIHTGIGLPTLTGAARFVVSLANSKHAAAMRDHLAPLMTQLLQGLSDQSATLRKIYADALGYCCSK
jgi:hypothetical protein